MSRGLALVVLGVFALGGLALAWWGWGDIRLARNNMETCAASVVIDNSAFYFLGMVCLPMFLALAFVPERAHRALLAASVGIFLGVPGLAYIGFAQLADRQAYDFSPPLSLFGLTEFTGTPGAACSERF